MNPPRHASTIERENIQLRCRVASLEQSALDAELAKAAAEARTRLAEAEVRHCQREVERLQNLTDDLQLENEVLRAASAPKRARKLSIVGAS